MKYRKKPVVVDAMPFNGELALDPSFAAFVEEYLGPDNTRITLRSDGTLRIPTLEGEMVARNGDWIIKGVKGEFYPCKPDIFEATYDPVKR